MWFAGFATAASIALATVLLPQLQGGPDRYQTDEAERWEVTLADGSRMHLNSTSAVEVSFDDEVRQLARNRSATKSRIILHGLRVFCISSVFAIDGVIMSIYRRSDGPSDPAKLPIPAQPNAT